ncbi:MAG: hypothetical protein B6I31_02615 [Desulfobacteraceae bacterium 4572_19]|nr:MAG: hypothetical protein B6I31_02615 [Desulfobacteraceae bacterium 4572_19]
MNVNNNADIATQPLSYTQTAKQATPSPSATAIDDAKKIADVKKLADTKEADQPVEKPQTTEEIQETVENLNTYMDDLQTNLGFKINDDSEDIVIMVTNRKTDEVVKQIPSEALLKLRDKMEELTGLLLSETV